MSVFKQKIQVKKFCYLPLEIYLDLLFNFDQGLRVEREHDLGKQGPETAGPLQQAGQPLQQVGNKPEGQQIYLFFLSKGYL